MAKSDFAAVALYASENDLLDTKGWKRFKQVARRKRMLDRHVKQAKLRSFNTAPRYKYGYEIACNYEHTVILDKRNGNNKWQEANDLKFGQLFEYSTFRDMGSRVNQTTRGI